MLEKFVELSKGIDYVARFQFVVLLDKFICKRIGSVDELHTICAKMRWKPDWPTFRVKWLIEDKYANKRIRTISAYRSLSVKTEEELNHLRDIRGLRGVFVKASLASRLYDMDSPTESYVLLGDDIHLDFDDPVVSKELYGVNYEFKMILKDKTISDVQRYKILREFLRQHNC